MSDIVARLEQRAGDDTNGLWAAAVEHIMKVRAERNSARADLAEALTALRELYEAHDIGERDLEPYEREHIIDGATEFARAILSKHAKPEGGAT